MEFRMSDPQVDGVDRGTGRKGFHDSMIRGNSPKWWGFVQDITDRKRTEQTLQKSRDELELPVRNEQRNWQSEAIAAERRRLYEILETMPVMVCLLTPDHHYAFVNRSFREKFGDDDHKHCFDRVFGKKETL